MTDKSKLLIALSSPVKVYLSFTNWTAMPLDVSAGTMLCCITDGMTVAYHGFR